MSRAIIGGTVVSMLLVLGMSAPSLGEHPARPLMRVSNVASQSQDFRKGPTAELQDPEQVRGLVPEWLDDLLASVPQPLPPQPAPETPVAQPPAPQQPTATVTETPATTESDNPGFPRPRSIPPLYSSPPVDGEGSWTSEGMPEDAQGKPLMYRTVYRPSVDFPNSMVHMALFDMKRIKPRFFVGQTEPGIMGISEPSTREDHSKIVAVTNAMWMQRHAKGAGGIFRGQEVYPMVNGMATMVVYRDDSVDILEWTDEIPRHLIKDARQLRFLIVKDGRVVDQVAKSGKVQDSEIGLGGFLVDNNGVSTMRNKFWFLANRTAFGIREDGNLVFAMAHHCSTKDLAKSLVLAGCKRAIHADANIHNIVCNFYFRSDNGKIVKRDKLSPEQLNYTMKRYDNGYAKDFFAFYER